MNYMFYKCSSLEEVYLSDLNADQIYRMYHIFYGCNSLKKEKLPENIKLFMTLSE